MFRLVEFTWTLRVCCLGAADCSAAIQCCDYDHMPAVLTVLSVQEVAGNHAVSLWGRTEAGYATDPIMVERNLIFAATRIQIEMETYPKWCVTHSSLPCQVAAASGNVLACIPPV